MLPRVYEVRVPLGDEDLVVLSSPQVDGVELPSVSGLFEGLTGSPSVFHAAEVGHDRIGLAVLSFLLREQTDVSRSEDQLLVTPQALALYTEPELVPVRQNPFVLESIGGIASTAAVAYFAGPIAAVGAAGGVVVFLFAKEFAKASGKKVGDAVGDTVGDELKRRLSAFFERHQ